ISKYNKIISELRSEIAELKKKLQEKEKIKHKYIQKESNEKNEMEILRSKLIQQFRNQMKIRRNLMEIEEHERQNALEILKKENEIQRWELDHPLQKDEPLPLGIITLQKDIESMYQYSKQFNVQKMKQLKLLEENIKKTQEIQETVPLKLKNNELRQIIEQEARLHDQMVTNLDLERMVQCHRAREQRMS